MTDETNRPAPVEDRHGEAADVVVEEFYRGRIEEIGNTSVVVRTKALDGEEGVAELPMAMIPKSEREYLLVGAPIRISVLMITRGGTSRRSHEVRLLRPSQWQTPPSEAYAGAHRGPRGGGRSPKPSTRSGSSATRETDASGTTRARQEDVARAYDYDDTFLVERLVRYPPTNRRAPRWSHVAAAFSIGSGRSTRLCRRFGADPHEMIGEDPDHD